MDIRMVDKLLPKDPKPPYDSDKRIVKRLDYL